MNNKSENILNFYIKNNYKKEKIVEQNDNRDISLAEHTVLSCINALGLYSEIYDDINIDNVIKEIVLKDFSDYELSFLNKERLNVSSTQVEHLVAQSADKLAKMDLDTTNSAYPEIKLLSDNYKKLQNMIRKGHIYWNVRFDRKESILEHIYGCLLLAIGFSTEYDYYIDFNKVIKMLLLHETEEILIGDKTVWDISAEDKRRLGNEAVKLLLSNLKKGEEYKSLIEEFNNNMTIEANYANLIDKLEYDLQVKVYDMKHAYDFNNIPNNVVTNSIEVRNILDNGAQNVFDVHYEYDKSKYVSYPSIRKILELSKKL